MSILKCPVCNQLLFRINNAYKCSMNHSYDIAKKNYVNLTLANQGHHLNEGDSKDMIIARKRFLESEKYGCLKNNLISIISKLSNHNSIFTDIACGNGYYTNSIHQSINKDNDFYTLGIDISKHAIIQSSSSRNLLSLSNIDYVIGNMDYLPIMSDSVDILLNCFAPINEKEFYRVLKSNGYFIRVLPGVYHLYELKDFLYENVHLNIPKEENINGFNKIDEINLEDMIELNNEQINDLFTMTPYYYKTSKEAYNRLKSLNYLKTRISFTIRIYQKI
ncbi:MAG: methyltransferase domain-containing protein [Bacillales bacterium]|nr:methyltransferase domain-containing protein [Bacillales bacterium]